MLLKHEHLLHASSLVCLSAVDFNPSAVPIWFLQAVNTRDQPANQLGPVAKALERNENKADQVTPYSSSMLRHNPIGYINQTVQVPRCPLWHDSGRFGDMALYFWASRPYAMHSN